MDARITKDEAAFLLPATTLSARRQAEIEAIRLAAMAARDAAVAEGVRRALRGIARGIRIAVQAVLAFPARLATYQALSQLSDRELRDIGMTRFDISRVFDPAFEPRPANDDGQGRKPRAA